jgi:hypothetical protein
MTLTSITLHRPAVDNADGFQDAGADLIVGDERKAGVIDASRARDLVNSHGAAGHHAATAKSKTSAKRRPAKKKPDASVAGSPVEQLPVEPGTSTPAADPAGDAK